MSKKPRKKKEYDDDDGRTIANMNVEGMPWYRKTNIETEQGSENTEKITLTKSEGRAMLRGVLLATLTVGAVFFGAIALFILFCIYVWFR